MITTIPVEAYVTDNNGINLTLQAAARIIVDSFKNLATTGIPIHDLPSVGGHHVPLPSIKTRFLEKGKGAVSSQVWCFHFVDTCL